MSAPDPEKLEFVVLGWPPDGPKLRLDYERFSYAGKFVMTSTGKAVARVASAEASAERTTGGAERARSTHGDSSGHSAEGSRTPLLEDDSIVAAVAFNEDRTDERTLWLRYITVRRDLRGEGIGPRLVSLVRERALERDYERVRIAVNNPFAYEALARAGFGYTGEETGLSELVLEYPPTAERADAYWRGLERFRERELTDAEREFLAARLERGPPARLGEAPKNEPRTVDDGRE
ncbi:GNAT family N-acetyltransferase [Natronobiforma cellulositropha]|uniref:GNAT family N-acetyltransferase n=1 Tax=Natronobiforma cellulositropha TaxID=1679076 RepID=UPI0021D60F6E|nr:GNAT family N-acetyltransferase [Natronobiforma cellulositropha]